MKSTSTQSAGITRLSHDGRGIAHCNGKTTFIDNALPGETVEFIRNRHHAKFDEGVAVTIVNPAVNRVAPRCSSYGVCGGCSLQHLASASQIDEKQKIVAEQLKHIGGISSVRWLKPLVGSAWGYRHKARLGVRFVEKKQQLMVGFREKYHSRLITDMTQCEILHPSVGHNIENIKLLINNLEAKRHIAQIEIAVGDNATALVIRHLQALSDNDIKLLITFGEQHHYHIYLQPNKPSPIHCIWPSKAPLLSYRLDDYDLEMQFHPCDFTQINPEVNRQMINLAVELLDCKPHDVIGDLFCGLGNFSLPLAKHCLHLIGIEGDETMVARAKHNATLNNITNAQFFCADLFDKSSLSQLTQPLTKLLLDPPRSGALEICQQLKNFKLEKIVYVSCNPATMARDAAEIVSQGYQLKEISVCDQFPHTSHIETIALFERREKNHGKN